MLGDKTCLKGPIVFQRFRFLGYVDMHGTTYDDDFIATGFGAYFAMTLLRAKATPEMTEE